MMLLIWFHIRRRHDFRHFYCTHGHGGTFRGWSHATVCRTRSADDDPLIAFQMALSADVATRVSFVDSTTLCACHSQRTHAYKVFKGIAALGKSSMGWFYGFKLHLVVSEHGHVQGWVRILRIRFAWLLLLSMLPFYSHKNTKASFNNIINSVLYCSGMALKKLGDSIRLAESHPKSLLLLLQT